MKSHHIVNTQQLLMALNDDYNEYIITTNRKCEIKH